MAIDIIARGLATSLVGSDGKIASNKMPVLQGTADLSGFTSIGKLTDPSLVEGKTAEEILLMMLYGVVSPTLTDPSLSILVYEESLPLVIGRESLLKVALTFDRGKIEPAYGTSGYRSGPLSYFTVNDNITSLSEYELYVLPTSTEFEVTCEAYYEQGEQPLNSIGQPTGAPLPAGVLRETLMLSATYPLYNAAGEDQAFTWFEDDDGQGYLSVFSSEGTGTKQSFCVSDEYNVVGIKAYDPLTQQWNWLGGETAKVSLTHFDTTSVTGESLGETTNYTLYTHNQPASGERELRIYVI